MRLKWTAALTMVLIGVAGAHGSAAAARAVEEPSNSVPDPMLSPGFVAFFNNQYDEAIAYFKTQLKTAPNNPGQYNHLAQAMLYRELYRNGALESQLVSGNNAFLRRDKMNIDAPLKQQLMAYMDRAQTLGEAVVEKNPRDSKAWYELGVTHGLKANYSFLVEKAWTDSLKEATAARKADEHALEIDPNFVDANLIPAVYQYVVGSLPFFMRALGFIGGFHGDRDAGLRNLERVASKGTMNRYDAQVLLAVLYRREHEASKAIPLLKSLAQKFPRNNLFRFEQVQMYSDLGDYKSANEVLSSIEREREAKTPGFTDVAAGKVQFVAGNLHFWYNDLPAALSNFVAATHDAQQLDLSMAVLAWLRLGQVHDLQGHRLQAVIAYRETIKTAPGSEVAAEAKTYLNKPYRRKAKQENNS